MVAWFLQDFLFPLFFSAKRVSGALNIEKEKLM